MTKGNCETCGARPPTIKEGQFAGQPDLLDYCAYCSADLCDRCMSGGTCVESPDRKHKREESED